MIPIYKPYLEPYKSSALKAISDEWISNHGIYVELAANKLKEILGAKYCILMNNGTSATHALYKALKFKYPAVSKIYIPNHVFIAPWNCGLMEYPETIFEVMRTDHQTMNIDTSEEYIRTLDHAAAVIIVHNLGNIVNVPRLKRLRPDLIFVEDNCEGLFGKYEGAYSGTSTATLCSAISFYGNKTITTGEGGAFLTNDIDLYKYMKTFYSHGMGDVRYVHTMLGTNYRMTNVQAGFLYDQLNDITHILAEKSRVYDTYIQLLSPIIQTGVTSILQSEPHTSHSKWMFTLFLNGVTYADIERYMLEKNVQIRPIFYDIHAHPHLQSIRKCEDPAPRESASLLPRGACSSPLIAATQSVKTGFMLPSYPELTEDQITYIVSCIREYIVLNL